MSPGWVKTGTLLYEFTLRPGDGFIEMGGPGAQIEVADSVPAMLKVIQNLKPTDSGAFMNREGKTLPW
jgi:hypothetical protein